MMGAVEAEEGWDRVEAHRWIDFPSCRLVTESTVYSGKLQLFLYLPNDATVYERAPCSQTCVYIHTHRERERKRENGKDTRRPRIESMFDIFTTEIR